MTTETRRAVDELAALEREDSPIRAVTLEEILQMQFEPRPWLLRGFLQERDLGMVHSFRGYGKTHYALGAAYAVAAGAPFLRYEATEPRGVLYVDGELPREELRERLNALNETAHQKAVAPFKLLAADMLNEPLPSLAREPGQRLVEDQLEAVSLIVLDSVSTLCSSELDENLAESWQAVQEFLLSLRRRGFTVLLVHHDGKGGTQRGTSKREDVLSQVVQLVRPADYSPALGCRFEVHLRKGRGVLGEDAEPFEAEYRTDQAGRAVWTWRPIGDAKKRQILSLYRDGVTVQRRIAEALGIGPATVNRKLKELRDEGAI